MAGEMNMDSVCLKCKHANRDDGGGNLLCGLDDTARDGLTAVTRRHRAAEAGSCFLFEGKDPIADINDLPGNVPAMSKAARKGTGSVPEIKPFDIDPMERPLWEIDKDALNPFEELPPIQTWCLMGDRPAFPKEGITLIQAKPKQGKSYATYAVLIPLLTMEKFDTITPLERPRLVLVFDMEMGKTTLINRVFKQMQVLGDNGKRFIVYPIKHLNLDERLLFIQDKVKVYNPDIVVIDQVGQLSRNVNDHEETASIIRDLESIGLNRAVIAIIHENKGKDDKNARGSLGSYVQQAQVETYVASKAKGVFTITPKEARDTDTDDAAPFKFVIDGSGCITTAEAIVKANEAAEREKWRKNFAQIFGSDERLSYTEMEKRICQKEQLKESAAQDKIKAATDLKVIIKVGKAQRDPYVLSPE